MIMNASVKNSQKRTNNYKENLSNSGLCRQSRPQGKNLKKAKREINTETLLEN